MQQILARAFARWVPFAVAITGVMCFAYVAVQQNYRQQMNDPQIQLAEDAALRLSDGAQASDVLLRGTFDMRTTIAPWMTVYDAVGTPIASSVTLDGAMPKMPPGLLDASTWEPLKTWRAPSGPETRVSWQPRPDVREAVVLVHFDSSQGGGFVAVGRSMRTTEERIINLTQLAAVAWGTTILATLAVLFILTVLGWL